MTNNTATADLTTVTAGVLEHLNPVELVIDDNVRTDTAIDADFIASIATGVRQPVYAVRDSEGVVKVRDGQRRTLAAREAELATIPVYVVDAEVTETDDTEWTRRRIIDQVITNAARKALKGSEEAAAVEQLALTGLSATKIAKELHTSKKKVDAALATAASTAARDAVDNANLTLEQGMVLADYDDDPDAVAELIEAAAEGRFDHKAAELKENAPARAAINAKRAELAEQGYASSTVRLDLRTHDQLRNLVTADGTDATAEDCTAEHLIAYVYAEWKRTYTDAEGTPVDDETIDWEVEDEGPEVAAEEGWADPRTLTMTETATAALTWYHINAEADELQQRWQWQTNNPRRAPKPAADGQQPQLTEQEQARKDAESAARKQVIGLNKLAVAAQSVRREALRSALARKTLPKGKAVAVATFQATTTWCNADLYNLSRQNADAKKIAKDLLGGIDPMQALQAATGERAQVIALAITLAAHEANLPKESWQGGHEYFRSIGEGRTRYLQFLSEVYGYELADIEKVVTGDLTADDIALT